MLTQETKEELRKFSEELFQQIKHGAEDHQEWLKACIETFTENYINADEDSLQG